MMQRLQKFISDCGLMSRRACEDEILKGAFTVNGRVAAIGDKVAPMGDVVKYKGRTVRPPAGAKLYYALYKPRGYVTTMSDEKGRKCVGELVGELGERVYPVGRLDMASEGLLLLTNDGAVADRLTHPKGEVAKVYTLKCRGKLSPEQLMGLGESIEIDGRMTAPALVLQNGYDENGNTSLRVTLHEGRNRQIRRLCESVGAEVVALRRIAIGKIALGGLRPGEFRSLTPEQVKYLKSL